MSEVARTDP
jgi:hypothetical protein